MDRDRERIENKVRLGSMLKACCCCNGSLPFLTETRLPRQLHFCYQSSVVSGVSSNISPQSTHFFSPMEKLKDIIKSYFCIILITIFAKGNLMLYSIDYDNLY